MSEPLLAANLRQKYLEACSEEDQPFFERMSDRDIIERMLHCGFCDERILPYETAISATTTEDLGKLMAHFGEQKHFIQCFATMEQIGKNGPTTLVNLWKLRNKIEDDRFAQENALYQEIFDTHKQEILDSVDQQPNTDET